MAVGRRLAVPFGDGVKEADDYLESTLSSPLFKIDRAHVEKMTWKTPGNYR